VCVGERGGGGDSAARGREGSTDGERRAACRTCRLARIAGVANVRFHACATTDVTWSMGLRQDWGLGIGADPWLGSPQGVTTGSRNLSKHIGHSCAEFTATIG
jgi:hypothetical protein